MQQLFFERKGYNFIISSYKNAGKAQIGMSENKIFYHDGSYYKNQNDRLFEIMEFRISSQGKDIPIEDYKFDTCVRVGAVIVWQNKVLLIKRNKAGKIYHVYPGGHVKQNERDEEALIREIYEEVGIDISNSDLQKLCELEKGKMGTEIYYKVKLESMFEDLSNGDLGESDGTAVPFWADYKDIHQIKNLFPEEVARVL